MVLFFVIYHVEDHIVVVVEQLVILELVFVDFGFFYQALADRVDGISILLV